MLLGSKGISILTSRKQGRGREDFWMVVAGSLSGTCKGPGVARLRTGVGPCAGAEGQGGK